MADSEPFVHLDMARVADQKGQLKIVVCGKVQTGKSSLINSILETEAAIEHLSPKDQSHIDPKLRFHGTQLKVHSGQQQKTVDILLWDSPGLGGAFGNNETDLHDVVEQVKKTDLLVYSLDMRARLQQDDVDGIVQLTSSLGEDIWRNAVFALTYANAVKPPPGSPTDPVAFFLQLLEKWESDIKKVLRNQVSLSEDIITSVVVVPVGYRKYPPPDRRDWLTRFWKEAFRKVKKNALLEGIDLNNLKIGTDGINWMHVGVGIAAGVTVGAVTGGLGLGVVGAVVGAGVGGVGGGASVAIVEHRNKK